MTVRLKNLVFLPLMLAFWLIPLFPAKLPGDVESVKGAAAYVLFVAAVFLYFLIPKRFVAFLFAFACGVGIGVLRLSSAFDILPALLLCCWLRSYLEHERGIPSAGYLELFTDLIYVYFAVAVIRLVRRGYTSLLTKEDGTESVPVICLMTLVFLLFLCLCVFGVGKRPKAGLPVKKQKDRSRRAEKRIVGLFPVYVSVRTFWGFCALLLAVCILQYTNAALIDETFLFLQTGFRLMFLPWVTLLYYIGEAFLPRFDVMGVLSKKGEPMR